MGLENFQIACVFLEGGVGREGMEAPRPLSYPSSHVSLPPPFVIFFLEVLRMEHRASLGKHCTTTAM
jgi:hypothetical protein